MRCRLIAAAVALNLTCWTWPASAEEPSAIGYSSVAAALKALRADPTATESTQRGWTVFVRAGSYEIWSFTPADHPAHPSAAKRTMYQSDNGGWHVVTQMLCQSTKASCDALKEEYRQLDEQMKERIRRERGPGI
jgi:hypothetical protein